MSMPNANSSSLANRHVHGVLTTIRKHIDPSFAPRSVLDFGCGVGRLLIPFAKIADDVVGLDVSSSMLQEARQNCDEHRVAQRALASVRRRPVGSVGCIRFDSLLYRVSAHPRANAGGAIFAKLLQHLRPGGVGALQLTYSKTRFASTRGVAPPAPVTAPLLDVPAQPIAAGGDPEMQMNPYNMNEILFLMQRHGVQRVLCRI